MRSIYFYKPHVCVYNMYTYIYIYNELNMYMICLELSIYTMNLNMLYLILNGVYGRGVRVRFPGRWVVINVVCPLRRGAYKR